ncbi:MAG: TonB-dependent receptor [Blastocatellia bacterium]|nr:MAG: TonB-dependent receptor [Blastocatellia bacterium]
MNNFVTTRNQWVPRFALLITVGLATIASMYAQVTTGNIRGVVKDQNGALVQGASVELANKLNGSTRTTQTSEAGEFEFPTLLPGDYTITVAATTFKSVTLNDVKVELNKTTDIPVLLAVGLQTETINVSAAGSELIQTTTTTLSKNFSERQVVDLAQTGLNVVIGSPTGVNNLSLLAPNVSSSGGVGVGFGGSVGGQRPRNNNFIVDGVDNNNKVVTGPQVYITPEAVSEFSLLQNQFSAEYGHSTGGQFITVTKSGTNEFHGRAYEFLQNRRLIALDTLQKNAGIVRDPNAGDSAYPRFDFNRWGGNVGGPILKNKLFFFSSWEQFALGQAASPGGISAPTAAGLATLAGLPGISQSNLGVFKQYVPVAPTNNAGTIKVAGVDIPVGTVAFAAPNFSNQKNFMLNIDYTQSSNTQHRGRFTMNNLSTIDNTANLPVFFTDAPVKGRLFSYTLTHNFSPNLMNETRLAYRRFDQNIVTPNISFPGLDQFPNIGLLDLGINIGPNPFAPQFTIENNYQVVDNVTLLHRNHSLKFGGDFRKLISPQSFVQRARGDYEYNTSDLYFRDIAPDFLGQRSVGSSPFYGDQILWFAFAQDDWRFRPNLTFNLGLSYVYQQVQFGGRQQKLNAIASVPGLITFDEPKSQKTNFAPRVGLAWSPSYTSGYLGRIFGGPEKSSIRASFQMAYDVIFDNIPILSLPPQFNQTIDVGQNGPGIPGVSPNFLKNGGIGPNPLPTGNDPAAARAATTAWIPDQKVPYSISWSLGWQREFNKDWALETRYVGSRGIHLPTQSRLNAQPRVFNGPGGFLPTFLTAPSQSTIDSLTLTLRQIQARSNILPAFAAAGFNGNIVTWLPNGNSTYHGGSVQLTRRFTNGFQMSAAYTLSHLIDDSTAEVFSTVLSPRRVQDFQNLRPERATSALNHTHRFAASSLYDLPYFTHSRNFWTRTLLGGVSLAGTLTIESGEYVTVLSGNDANQNGDSAGDRTIINESGNANQASAVVALLKTCPSFTPGGSCTLTNAQRTVGYVATNPNARYIQTGNGALSNAGRNTFLSPAIQNVDFSVFKNFAVTETKKIQIGADFFNLFNHPQYVPGSISTVDPINSAAVSQYNTIAQGLSNLFVPSHVFSSHPRLVQLRLRFTF